MRGFLLIFLFIVSSSTFAQTLPAASIRTLQKVEDSLKFNGRKMIEDPSALKRFVADSTFIKMLVRGLKTPNSFYYPFDSLETVSRIYAPDSTFRVFSWQFSRDENYHRQRGAIQMRTADGSLELYPLVDMSDFTTAPQDSARTGKNWIGSIYYGIVMKTFNDRKYYTLIGFDDNNMRTTKKWIEVLTFDNQNRPIFGGPYFSIPTDEIKTSNRQARFLLEYKKDGRARLNYDKELDMIIFDHLVSESNEPDKVHTMVPDGDYQGFKWNNGKWVLVDKVFDYKLEDGQAPVPEPLRDETGKNNEQKLMQQSEKNKQKQPKPAPAKKPEPKRVEPRDENEY